MKLSRRQWLLGAAGTGTVTAAAVTGWLSLSHRWPARWFRTVMADTQRSMQPAPVRPTPLSWSDQDLTACWLGHATVLINFLGVRILTDPVLGARVGLSLGLGTLGPKRFIAPALSLDQLPRLDLVLLSHAHMDHLDLRTLRRLPAEVQVVTAWDTSDFLPPRRFRQITELRWGEATVVETAAGPIEVKAFEVRHWGRRWPKDRERGYNGYVLTREGRSILFGGDTALTPLFRNLRPDGPFDVAFMPIAAYQPYIQSHCTPEQAVQMANEAGARHVAAIHHQTYRLSNEPLHEPLERFVAALDREPDRIAFRGVGETLELG
ncbi:MAG: MBL fold metallo-hydrolase [Limisphaerales bacterium]